MIIFLDSQGSLVNKQYSPIYQGSNMANEIVVVAPIPKATQVLAYFTLPNKNVTKPRLVKAETSIIDKITLEDKEYGIWSLKLDRAVTSYYGKASVQFYFVGASETLTSENVAFDILEGIAPIKPEELDDKTTLEQILELLSHIYNVNDTLEIKVEEAENKVNILENKVENKQDKLTAGANIIIKDNVISAIGGGSGGEGSSGPIDTELDKESFNAVANSPVATAIEEINQDLKGIEDRVVDLEENGSASNIVVDTEVNADSDNAISNKAVFENYVRKATTKSGMYLYARDGANDKMLGTTSAAHTGSIPPGQIPRYNYNYNDTENEISAVLLTGTPKYSYHAANKKYVDEQFNKLQSLFGEKLYAICETTDTYNSRETANGMSIVNNSQAVIKRVQGNTMSVDGVLKNATFKGIKSTGKNLFDSFSTPDYNSGKWEGNTGGEGGSLYSTGIAGTLKCNGTVNGGANGMLIGYLKAGTKITISCYLSFSDTLLSNLKDDSKAVRFVLSPKEGAYSIYGDYATKSANNTKYVKTFSIIKDGTYYLRPNYFADFNVGNVFTLTGLMINFGETALDFEPYYESKTELLNKVELGKWDIIEDGRIEKYTKQVTINGTEDWRYYGNNDGIYVYTLNLTDKASGLDTSVCNMFEYDESLSSVEKYKDDSSSNLIYFSTYVAPNTIPSDNATTEELISAATNWKNHLASLSTMLVVSYMANAPIIVEGSGKGYLDTYTVTRGGIESVIENDNSSFGVYNTLTQEYVKILEVPNEN